MKYNLTIIGGGLAGCEAAWQAAQRGMNVLLYEMRPAIHTGAHQSDLLAELVCSNSLGSDLIDRASGVLKAELRRLGSLLIECADQTSLPAGGALAVDRERFSSLVTQRIISHPSITVLREEMKYIPDGITIIASGPLTSPHLVGSIIELTGQENLYFFDAIAPIISFDSINMSVAFWGSRYQRGVRESGDYINCPMSKDEYERFYGALINAKTIDLNEIDLGVRDGVKAGAKQYFEGCMPVEVLAKRGEKALLYGPFRPVGLSNPHSDKRPFAIVQLRQDNLVGSIFNLVGFQTNLRIEGQQQVIKLIPGLENAEIIRYGQMHRNTFIYSPELLEQTLQTVFKNTLFLAGQICGVEGYIASIGTGLLAGLNASRLWRGEKLLVLPLETILGALIYYITHASPADYQPMKANFGIIPPIQSEKRKNKRERSMEYSLRSQSCLDNYLRTMG